MKCELKLYLFFVLLLYEIKCAMDALYVLFNVFKVPCVRCLNGRIIDYKSVFSSILWIYDLHCIFLSFFLEIILALFDFTYEIVGFMLPFDCK